eukprot:4169264-Karenia_brevis.AAC.1
MQDIMGDLRDNNIEAVARAGRPERGREVREIGQVQRETIVSRGRWEPTESSGQRAAIQDRDRREDEEERPPTPPNP